MLMETIIAFRNDMTPRTDSPRRILSPMTPGGNGRKCRTRAQIAAERANAQRWSLSKVPKAHPVRMMRTGRLVPSVA
jgi:hypothetical protein